MASWWGKEVTWHGLPWCSVGGWACARPSNPMPPLPRLGKVMEDVDLDKNGFIDYEEVGCMSVCARVCVMGRGGRCDWEWGPLRGAMRWTGADTAWSPVRPTPITRRPGGRDPGSRCPGRERRCRMRAHPPSASPNGCLRPQTPRGCTVPCRHRQPEPAGAGGDIHQSFPEDGSGAPAGCVLGGSGALMLLQGRGVWHGCASSLLQADVRPPPQPTQPHPTHPFRTGVGC